jgi:hypothetical protein
LIHFFIDRFKIDLANLTGLIYRGLTMQHNNNSTSRANPPLFFPKDPEFGFSSASSGVSRRKFLKRTGERQPGPL